MRLVCLFILACSIGFQACTKEGPAGPEGQQGVPGPPGPQGPQGLQGAESNSNVKTGEITLTNAKWLYYSKWTMDLGNGDSLSFRTRYADVNTPLITANIVKNGTVLAYIKPSKGNGWIPLPYEFMGFYSTNYNFVYEYKEGKLRLHYFWSYNDYTAQPPIIGLEKYEINTYTFKYVIIAGVAARQMREAGVDTKDYNAVMQYLQGN